ncbi:MAG: GAF domain-containing SpoIIE family protein phosphatase [Cyanobacteriota bacterium]
MQEDLNNFEFENNSENENYSQGNIDPRMNPEDYTTLCEELRAAYQALLNNVLISNKLLAQETEEDDILSLLLSITRLIIDFESGAVFRLEGGSYRQVSSMDINKTFEEVRNNYLSEGIYEWAANQKRTLVMPEGENNTHILVPMITEKANIGILDLMVPFSADLIRTQDIDLLWVVVSNASSRCEQIQLNRWSGLVDILLLTLEKVNSSQQLDMLFDSIIKGLDRLLNCSKYLLLIRNNNELTIKARYDNGTSYCIPHAYKNNSKCELIEKTLNSKNTLRIPSFNESNECKYCPFLSKRPDSDSYLMIVPLIINTNVYGAIAIIDDSYNSKLFTDDSQHIVEIFANQVTIAIYQAQLRDEVQRKNATINKEIKMAGMVQQSLLPETKQQFDLDKGATIRLHINNNNYSVTGFYSPCSTLGGDFYDIVEENNYINLTIADVSGHGLSSSLITALYKMALHKFVNSNTSVRPNEICTYLNNDLCKFIKTGDYITAFLAFFDKETKKLTFSSAGHPYPIYYKASDNSYNFLEANGLPFAMLDNQEYPVKSIDLYPGDKVLMYTDGITEAIDDQMKMFKKEGLVESVKKHPNLNSVELIKKIFEDVTEYTQSDLFPDDITMLLIEIK